MHCPNSYQLTEYLDGICAPHLHQRLSEHIEGCERCRQEIAALQQTVQMLRGLPTPGIPDNLWAGVATRISSPSRQGASPWVWKTAAGVGLVASLLIGIWVSNPPAPSLPYATTATSSYVTQHQLLSARDPLSDRAHLGVVLTADEGGQ